MPVFTFIADGWADPEPDGADISGLSPHTGDLNAVTEAGHRWSLMSRHWSHCLSPLQSALSSLGTGNCLSLSALSRPGATETWPRGH